MIKEGNFLNVCLLKKDKMAASFKKWWFYFRSGLSVFFFICPIGLFAWVMQTYCFVA
jgi:hypothetical protein